ncbi:MAG: TonB-dependent receptor plug domain-containing protein [Melioribacteraceae bacterium]|nr:TonB-dependent receptor plug domain-containing protein [Melioribacteraceae bacterium]MCF8353556.1 TonB-dependent receptor plug domain-containing protein [Melioribacteraceae bacterium]MCF8392510.1 TonB-dependent receptor plug domain-containing protein [Melioribacteraceae bacterium]
MVVLSFSQSIASSYFFFSDTTRADSTFPGELSLLDSTTNTDSIFTPDSVLTADSLAAVDSLSAVDSLAVKVIRDTLVPIFQMPLDLSNQKSFLFTKDEIDKTDYRFLGDILTNMPFSHLQDLGSFGQPSEMMFYGLGSGNVSYLSDGVFINNRMINSLNLFNFQSEYIDSLEYFPLARGFIYGTSNNPVAINFITRDKLGITPFTRIRFYQAPDEEGYLDGIFNAYFGRRINGSFEFTNSSIDSRYSNSQFTGWKASARVRWMPNNFVNFIGSYSYVRQESWLFGGVDYDTLSFLLTPGEVEEIIFAPLDAPVNYESRSIRYYKHYFNLKSLFRISKHYYADMNFYYHFDLNEYRQNEKSNFALYPNIPVIIDNNRTKTYGMSLRQLFYTDVFNIDVHGIYEYGKYTGGVLNQYDNTNTYSVSGKMNFNLIDTTIVPSVFGKYLNERNKSYFGIGGDVLINYSDNISLYGGLSRFEKPLSVIEYQYAFSPQSFSQVIQTFEGKALFKLGAFSGSIGYFFVQYDDKPVGVIEHSGNDKVNEISFFTKGDFNIHGINGSVNYKLWRFHLENNFSYYLTGEQYVDNSLPQFTLKSGLYYKSKHFNNNLDLKTGLNFKLFGSQDYLTYDFEKNLSARFSYSPSTLSINQIKNFTTGTGYQIDFFLAGEIQESAIIYFVFENILDNTYYVVPFYPVQSRSIRLGVAWDFLD